MITQFLFVGLICITNGLFAVAQSTSQSTPSHACSKLNASCEACLSNPECMYCYSTGVCQVYPVGKLFPDSNDCPSLNDARWGVCWINFKVLVIVCCVAAILLIVGLSIACVCCCFCRKRKARAHTAERSEDIHMEAQRREAQARSAERRAEMERKHSEIRKKYGLFKSSDTPYRNLEEEA